MSILEERLKSALQKREAEGNLRKLTTQRALVDFFSNDYLGLARNEQLQQLIAEEYEAITKKIAGATGSRLLSGNNQYYEELEVQLSQIFKGSTLIFNSGYTANLAIFSSIPQKGDTIIYDELIHVCIKEGARLSFADRFSFKHNNPTDLEAKLRNAKGAKFVAIESVYSMDGDFAAVNEIVSLAQKYNAYLIVDEAHSTGVFGKNGNGLICEFGMEDSFYIRTYTFGKAIGSHGACVVADPVTIQYLINFARSFIYTTGLPLHNLVTLQTTFEYLKDHGELPEQLFKLIRYFKSRISEVLPSDSSVQYIPSDSAIQAIIVPGNHRVKELAGQLIEQGFDVRPILSPTVAEGKERLRICLHVYNTVDQLDQLVAFIKEYKFD